MENNTKEAGRSISKEELTEFELEEFPGDIIIIDSIEDSKAAFEELSGEEILGFDTETRPSFKKGNSNSVALIQLATLSKCFLFRVNKTGFTPELIAILSDPDITKVGLSIKDDFTSMKRRLSFAPKGFVDLQQVVPNHDILDLSLQKIYALLFRKKISKNQRLSNWEAETLSEAQQKYAALDAWACLKIYKKLCHTNEFI